MFGIATFATTLVAVAVLPDAFGSSLRRLNAASFQDILREPRFPYCFVEHGFDYVGNDLTNVPGNYDQCCDKCFAAPGCGAWSWTNQNGGTCWLKTARGEIVVNANVKSALYFRGFHPTCTVIDGIDYVGNDLARVDGATVDACCEVCQKTAGCRAYTWSNHQGGSCWLKSNVTQIVSKPGAKSALAYPDINESCLSVSVNVDFEGNDIGNKPSSSYGGCCGLCQATPGCRAYSWSNYQGGTCWLKSQSGNGRVKDGVVSSQVYPYPDPPQCTLQTDVDYVGNDLANVPGKDATECCSKCRGYNGCKAWSWSNYNGGTCWLKNQKGATAQKLGVSSGEV
jgi:hypothetical protein